jgi:hypothetical protein
VVEINRSNNNNQHQHQHQVSHKPGQVQAASTPGLPLQASTASAGLVNVVVATLGGPVAEFIVTDRVRSQQSAGPAAGRLRVLLLGESRSHENPRSKCSCSSVGAVPPRLPLTLRWGSASAAPALGGFQARTLRGSPIGRAAARIHLMVFRCQRTARRPRRRSRWYDVREVVCP